MGLKDYPNEKIKSRKSFHHAIQGSDKKTQGNANIHPG